MSRKWTLLTLILSLCSSGALQANPLDSPGVVYIDGLPCNRACQSYMAWTDQALSARHREQRETDAAVPAEAEIERPAHAGPRTGGKAARTGVAPRAARWHRGVEGQDAEHQEGCGSKSRISNNPEASSGGDGDSGSRKGRRRRPGAGA